MTSNPSPESFASFTISVIRMPSPPDSRCQYFRSTMPPADATWGAQPERPPTRNAPPRAAAPPMRI
ncbi:hypothetical protein BC477_03470 [Clavibacter michiganensis subsp. michiganensis]|uniref:Uncharacterized protein n=1 Tax=Clavibacter michiganensis subsp. michiganensis TaxID=33013 RepID=A0A251XKP1_CLAMM|nr:hypothetical protein BC477_03470 [Clavibacter michiganensis subsp. michiganensis]OUE03773.1 hypothetical protein CMMCAS07_02405 [Clavibacter michiganensis subsp. michiganensis]